MNGFYLYFTEDELKEIIFLSEGINIDDINLDEYSAYDIKEMIKDMFGI